MMKRYLQFLFLTILLSAFRLTDTLDDVGIAIQSNNLKQLTALMDNSVDLSLPEIATEDIYPKARAENLLKDFFLKNPVKSFSLVHRGSSKEGGKYAVGNYSSSNGNSFRVNLVLKNSAGQFLLSQLHFEKQ